jgi:hypothetical protein
MKSYDIAMKALGPRFRGDERSGNRFNLNGML